VKYIELAIDDALTHFSVCNDETLFEFVDCAFNSRGRIARELYNLANGQPFDAPGSLIGAPD
jgi:hypothetical protein